MQKGDMAAMCAEAVTTGAETATTWRDVVTDDGFLTQYFDIIEQDLAMPQHPPTNDTNTADSGNDTSTTITNQG